MVCVCGSFCEMRTFACVAVAAGLAAVAAANYGYDYEAGKKDAKKYAGEFKYGDDWTLYNEREYTENYMKCAGAPGMPKVDYKPCHTGYMCADKGSYADHEWGLYCVKYAEHAPKCYDEGERCMGAKDHPYVSYQPCCSEKLACMEDHKMGWGSFCKPIAHYKEVKVEKKKYAMEKYGKGYVETYGYYKCHASGSMCNSDGLDYWIDPADGCCHKSDKCVAVKGYHGKYCLPEAPKPKMEKKYIVWEYGHKQGGKPKNICTKTGYTGCWKGKTGKATGCCNSTDMCVDYYGTSYGYCKKKGAMPMATPDWDY